ncbi:MAG: hypothetical protein VX589_08050, partial [Myxococcota bacterium]|nr:hypothetical protein [Myxococcota bacterium]
ESTWVLEASNDGLNWTYFGRITTPTRNGCLTVWLDIAELPRFTTLSLGRSVDVGDGYRIRCSGHRTNTCLSAQIETIRCGVEAGWYRLSWTRNWQTQQEACDVFCTLADSMPVVSCADAGEIADDERLHAFPPNGVTFDHPGGELCDWPRVGRLQTNGSVNGNRIDVQCTW